MIAVLATPSYRDLLASFLAGHGLGPMRRDVPGIFHAVRNIPYASTQERTAIAVLTAGKGACTGKHLLLRDLLRLVGERADVALVAGDFAAAVPLVPSMPPALQHEIRTHGLKDYHCYTVWRYGSREIKLDATWGDVMAPLGFPVNRDWGGVGDTTLAVTPAATPIRVEDVIARKEKLLAALAPADRDRRRRFLDLLTAWMLAEQ
ncbi:MAG: hypothetical protein F9K38_07290 [Pseudorhodoplanes sp.]|nr:MAG: hypothetical protein F9K38_07290 [Pseudorhodoplanes sp.]